MRFAKPSQRYNPCPSAFRGALGGAIGSKRPPTSGRKGPKHVGTSGNGGQRSTLGQDSRTAILGIIPQQATVPQSGCFFAHQGERVDLKQPPPCTQDRQLARKACTGKAAAVVVVSGTQEKHLNNRGIYNIVGNNRKHRQLNQFPY